MARVPSSEARSKRDTSVGRLPSQPFPSTQCRSCGFRRLADGFEQGAGGASGGAFALLPVAERFDGDVEALDEGRLAEVGSGAEGADVGCGIGSGFGAGPSCELGRYA